MKYKIYSSLYEDIGTAAIWISGSTYPPRTIVKILCTDTKKSIYTEALLIEPNFLRRYNQSPRISITDTENSAVMNNWYRHLLGNIESKKTYDFDICIPTGVFAYWGRLRATMTHPQLAIRVGTWLGIIAVVISILIPVYENSTKLLEVTKIFWGSILNMSAVRAVGLGSAVLGMLGTILLFQGSFTLESPSMYMNQGMVDQMNARNRRRILLQRLGLISLLISFTLQAISQFLD